MHTWAKTTPKIHIFPMVPHNKCWRGGGGGVQQTGSQPKLEDTALFTKIIEVDMITTWRIVNGLKPITLMEIPIIKLSCFEIIRYGSPARYRCR